MEKKLVMPFLLLLTTVPAGAVLAQAVPAAPVAASTRPVSAGAVASKILSAPFADVPRNHWAFASVEVLRKAGIVRGEPRSMAPTARRHSH